MEHFHTYYFEALSWLQFTYIKTSSSLVWSTDVTDAFYICKRAVNAFLEDMISILDTINFIPTGHTHFIIVHFK